MQFDVTDDSGFLGLLDPTAYEGFVASDWELPEVLERVRREMARRHLLFWCTGAEGVWSVEVIVGRADVTGDRQVLGGIVASSGQLCLVNYEDLTMAAQFADVRLPQAHGRDRLFSVPSGSYACRVVQLGSERSLAELEASTPDFVIELLPSGSLPAPWEEIPWSEDLR